MKKFTKVPARKAVIAMCAALSVGIFAPLLWCEAAPASSYTAAANKKVYSQLDFSDEQERKFAERGLIEAPQALENRHCCHKEQLQELSPLERAHAGHTKKGAVARV